MSEARLHSPDPRAPRPMAGWAASLRDSGLLALAVPRVFAGLLACLRRQALEARLLGAAL
ncbi:hypothetical protein APA73_09160 [Pseudomonas aeruginosa]|nr:hypothetical protein APA58_15990 [Pseudomonas aeruginosa]KSM85889.1 hypothetical protein APA73_09160 [Pseudomonas aeruginosa]HBO6769962.1 hypothetical protein [Pseudomonas aeruginosa]HBO6815233.1 hypothetical protein [Pseudomonas aeruginosa]